ncbi:hypothetical protein C8F01DRAFT_1265327 [Mycena amicta]|nr:hypothetical protein C8F01DRAFT_1265327 [Mycena amicta]
MSSFVRHEFPFAKAEAPPPPAVLLLIHTDLDIPPAPTLLIHQDLEPALPNAMKKRVPSAVAKHKVTFAPELAPTYPPPPGSKLIPSPGELSRHALDGIAAWKEDTKTTKQIKITVHGAADRLFDTSQGIQQQDEDALKAVFEEAAHKHVVLKKYADDWPARVILTFHLKNTSHKATEVAKKKALAEVTQIAERVPKARRAKSNVKYIAM